MNRRALLAHFSLNCTHCDVALQPFPHFEETEVDYKLWFYSVFGKPKAPVPLNDWAQHLAILDSGDTRGFLKLMAMNSIVFRNLDQHKSLFDLVAKSNIHYIGVHYLFLFLFTSSFFCSLTFLSFFLF